MVLRENGCINSQESEGKEKPQEGGLLFVSKFFGLNEKNANDSERENIFQTRCLIQGMYTL